MLQSWSLSVASSVYRYLLSVCCIVLESTVVGVYVALEGNWSFLLPSAPEQPSWVWGISQTHVYPCCSLGRASTHFQPHVSRMIQARVCWQSQWSKESSIVCLVAALSSRAAEGCRAPLLLTILSVGDEGDLLKELQQYLCGTSSTMWFGHWSLLFCLPKGSVEAQYTLTYYFPE